MGVAFSLLLAVLAAVFVWLTGKDQSFLIINGSYHPAFDPLFRLLTWLGDGLIWIPLFLYVLLFRRDFLIPIISALILCTVLTHFFKRVVFPGELRPIGVLADKVRTIPGLYINRANSFPSGHTSTAFTLALLMIYLANRPIWTIFFVLVAFGVGYSRVYLAQHFVTDVSAGIVVGIVSSFLSLLIYQRYRQKKAEAAAPPGREDEVEAPL